MPDPDTAALGTSYTHTQTFGDFERHEIWYWKWDAQRKVALITRNNEEIATLSSEEHLKKLKLPEEIRLLLGIYMRARCETKAGGES